jgi:hypothetical protein
MFNDYWEMSSVPMGNAPSTPQELSFHTFTRLLSMDSCPIVEFIGSSNEILRERMLGILGHILLFFTPLMREKFPSMDKGTPWYEIPIRLHTVWDRSHDLDL